MTTSAEHRPPALVLEDVAVAYGSTPVLEGVTGRVGAGGALALVGPNGGGKTSLIKAVLGLAPVVRGRVEVLGGPPDRARGRVAYLPQAEELDRQFPVSALQVVLMGRYRMVGWLRRPGRAHKAVASEALERVGLSHRADARFGLLSGGQQQRVLLARALAQEAELILLDEPFNGVDSATTDLFIGVLAELRAAGTAIVMATHDLAMAHLACGDACLLNHRQVAFGAVVDALTPAQLRAAYGSGAVVLADDSTVVATN